MGKVLLVGKGKLFKYVKESIGATHTDTSNVETVDYDEEWFKPTRNLKECDGIMVQNSEQYNYVYLFPNSLIDGINLVRNFQSSNLLGCLLSLMINKILVYIKEGEPILSSSVNQTVTAITGC